ncbi:MAG: CoA transferase [Chloroflexi bacterium]|nr:CoA transferase [Chloroflexota bacterium]
MSKRKPLANLRVLDFTWVIAGPLLTRLLGVLGAQVIKVESTARIDLMRTSGPFRDGVLNVNKSGYFNNFNTDKMSTTLNIATREGREVVLRLAAQCDVVVENYAPGVLERQDLRYEAFRAVRPDVIMVRMPGMGLEGPGAHARLMGNYIQAAAGIDELSGDPERQPVGSGMSYPDTSSTPYQVLPALFAALAYRRATGEGRE